MRNFKIFLVLITFWFSACAVDNEPAHLFDQKGTIKFQSSDTLLNKSFEWAKQQALAYVFEGDSVGDWYEAALPKREAFCMRDLAHQAVGAHALGLQAYTKNMLSKFAENISESKDYCTYWEINRYNKPAPVDYINDKEFWYNLPANFDLLDACYRMYLWTNDKSYISSPEFTNYYILTLNEYVDRWDLSTEKIFNRKRFMNRESFEAGNYYQYCRGIPSYHEGDPGKTRLGIDQLAFMTAAYRSYASITHLNNEADIAVKYKNKASKLTQLIENKFWDANNNRFYDLLLTDGSYTNSGNMFAYLLYNDVLINTEKTESAINQLLNVPVVNVELRSHYPEILYRYGRTEEAYKFLIDISRDERNDYPEVSFAFVGAVVQGLMGIKPGSDKADLVTLPRLSAAQEYAELKNINVKGKTFNLKHIGNYKSIITNLSDKSIVWKVCFRSDEGIILLEGNRASSDVGADLINQEYIYTIINLAPNETVTAELFIENK